MSLEAVLSDADLLLLILKKCSCSGIGRAARICKDWQQRIRGTLDKAALRQWLINTSHAGVIKNGGAILKGNGSDGKMLQSSTMFALKLNRCHLLSMRRHLGMAADTCGSGYPMPATFDLLMDTPLPGRHVSFYEYFNGIPVDHGWDSFLKRNDAEQKYIQGRMDCARRSAERYHAESILHFAKKRRVHVSSATEACSRALEARLIETKQPLPAADILKTSQPFSEEHEAAARELKARFEAAAKAIGAAPSCNAALKLSECKQGTWYLNAAHRCECECSMCKSRKWSGR